MEATQKGSSMRAELKVAGYKLTGGGVTYAATYEGVQKVLENTPHIDYAVQAQLATIAAGYATAFYFIVMGGYVGWKWIRDWRASRRQP
ncbi:MAG: hypothetical protein JNM12_10125 [Alphaproteobacteria bacterium]|nr:hypothetical protein [Alphaproteobacteria bacterium]